MSKLFDLHHNCDVQVGYTRATVTTGTTVGEIIDMQGFHGLEMFVDMQTITNGAFALSFLESDDSAMAGAVAVSAEETLGDADFADTESDTAKRIGSVGKKRYQQLQVVATAAAAGGPIGALAVRFSPAHGPVAD